MKRVTLRIELGKKELEKKKITITRRDTEEKQTINIKDLQKHIEKTALEIDKNLIKQANKLFENNIINVESKNEIKKVIVEAFAHRNKEFRNYTGEVKVMFKKMLFNK